MKILILYVRSGGGHESAAKTIRNQIQLDYGDKVEVQILDVLSDSPNWVQWSCSQGYALLTEKLFPIWALGTIALKVSILARLSGYLMGQNAKPLIKKTIKDWKPDKVISTYFFGSSWAHQILNDSNSKAKTMTVVTEIFGAPSIWFLNKKGHYIVFSEYTKRAALEHNIQPEQITQFGFFFRKFVYNEAKMQSLMSSLNSPKLQLGYLNSSQKNNQDLANFQASQKPLILIVGGGDSMPNGEEILKNVLKSDYEFDLVFVCGRNAGLKNNCERILDVYYKTGGSRQVWILGFTEFLSELIYLSTIVVSKAGPATILEVLSQNKPLILSSYIWEQELGNVRFVTENQLGYYEPKPLLLRQRIEELIAKPELRENLIARFKKLGLKSDIGSLAKYLVES